MEASNFSLKADLPHCSEALVGPINESSSSLTLSHDSSLDAGQIRLEISNLSGLKSKTSSPFHYYGGLPWRLSAKSECSKRTNSTKFFSVYIDCDPESQSTLWSCEAVVEFHLINNKPQGNAFIRTFTNKFSFSSNNWGFPSFLEWTTVMDPTEGYVQNGTLVIEAYISIKRSVGVRQQPKYDFSQPQPRSNVTLIVENKPLYVNKDYLALYSPYFNALFFQNFSERNRDKVELKGVSYDEFADLLEVIYPSHKPINVDNVDHLLSLADHFQIDYVLRKCEKFLVKTDSVTPEVKLVYADRYSFSQLQHACISTFTSPEEIKQLRQTEEFASLSDASKSALLEKVLKLL